MRIKMMLIFFAVVFTIYFAANSYIFLKGYNALKGHVDLRVYSVAYIFLALTFIAGKIFERNSSSVIIDILNVIGGFWLAMMLYLFLALFLADLVKLVIYSTGMAGKETLPLFRYWSWLLSVSIAFIFITAGFVNAVRPVSRHYDITVDKDIQRPGPLRIAAVSDVHLGSVVRHRSLRVLSRMFSEAAPDYIFILGDLVDGEINPVIRDDLLRSLTLPVDSDHVLAITGNHEYIGGPSKTIPYIRSKGIRLLNDEVVELAEGIQVIGRKDRDSNRYLGEKRRSLEDLLGETDPRKPVILLDHQPVGKTGSEPGSFDLMLSGHTHNGQMWPFSKLVNLVYRDSYGYSKDERGQYIVSSGFGTWGPRVRLGSRAEIIVIDIHFGSGSL